MNVDNMAVVVRQFYDHTMVVGDGCFVTRINTSDNMLMVSILLQEDEVMIIQDELYAGVGWWKCSGGDAANIIMTIEEYLVMGVCHTTISI